MHRHRHPRRRDHPRRLCDVPLVRMHAAGRGQPRDVRRAPARPHLPHESRQRRVGGEAPSAIALSIARQVHPDDPAGADVGVPDLGVAHLPGRQPDVRPMRRQLRVRARRPDPVEVRRPRQRDGVALARRAQAPAIENAEDDRPHTPLFASPRAIHIPPPAPWQTRRAASDEHRLAATAGPREA